MTSSRGRQATIGSCIRGLEHPLRAGEVAVERVAHGKLVLETGPVILQLTGSHQESIGLLAVVAARSGR